MSFESVVDGAPAGKSFVENLRSICRKFVISSSFCGSVGPYLLIRSLDDYSFLILSSVAFLSFSLS